MPKHSLAATMIGERVQATRAKHGYSREEVAIAAGLDVSNVGRVERGESLPNLDTLLRLAAALEVEATGWIHGIDASMLRDKRVRFTVRDYRAALERERR